MQRDQKTGAIHFIINSAKRKKEQTEIRQFTVKNDSLAFRYLVSQLLFDSNCQLQLCDMNYKAASTEVGRLSEKAFNLEEKISPYCFRHAFSGDLHAANLRREQIAQCLGHGTDDTQSYYSHSTKHAFGSFNISNIISSEAVKPLTSARVDALMNTVNEKVAKSDSLN